MAWRDKPLYRAIVTGEPRRYDRFASPVVHVVGSIITGALLLGSWVLGGWYGLAGLVALATIAHIILRIRQGYWEL